MDITYQIRADVPILEIEEKWLVLQDCAQNNFFLNWVWIKSWLTSFVDEYLVIEASYDGVTIGLGIMTQRTYWRNGLMPINQILLHRTGVEKEDQIWVEFNDFLIHRDHENEVRTGIVTFIQDSLPDWDEVVVGASRNEVIEGCLVPELTRRDYWDTRTYWIDLERIRTEQGKYVDSLSKNTRYQINRTERLYCQNGDKVVLKRAECLQEAFSYLDVAKPMHIKRWENHARSSGFLNRDFLAFHRNLLREAFDKGMIDIFRISVGDRVIAIHYNFVLEGRVHFYLSAINFESDNKYKPGLMTHALLIQYYLDNGYKIYDMMGGILRYKESLATNEDSLFISHLQKNSWKYKTESVLRCIKRNVCN